MSAVEDGHLISALAKKKNVIDEEFSFAPKTQERWDDVKKIFLTKSETALKQLIKAYGINYIYISRNEIKRYGYQNLFDQSKLFEKIYTTNTTEVYHVECDQKK